MDMETLTISEIQEVMCKMELQPSEKIIFDGQIHRFSTNGKRGDKAGYYCFWDHSNGFVGGFFGDFRTGLHQMWHNKQGQALSDADRQKMAEQIQKAREEARREREAASKKAGEKALKMLEKAKPTTDEHPYLKAKQIKPHGINELGNALLIPVTDHEKKIHGLQMIYSDGHKRFLTGTAKAGHFFTFKGDLDTIYLCEGYATGASIHEATGQTVICAFDAGNLTAVAKAILKQYPRGNIVLAGDDDRWTADNPGRGKAEAAANAINGVCIFPRFESLEGKPTDFNDLAYREGIDEVREQLQKALIDGLAGLGPLHYERRREAAAKSLDIRVSVLDREIAKRRPREEGAQGSIIEDLEPWDETVDGEHILNEIKSTLKSHIIFDEHSIVACALWIILTYTYDAFRILPMLGITSPEKRCGKTTLLEVLQGLTKSALLASNITSSAFFRVIEAYQPCLLIDELDTFIKDNDELRGIINSGHTRKSAFVIRTNTETMEVERFSTWGPKAIAMIGGLPDTNRDRSISIRLKRKLPSEVIGGMSLDFDGEQLPLRRKLKRWAQDNIDHLKSARPDIPNVGNDRATDNWIPLISIAELAGGEWPELARRAIKALEMTDDKDTIRQMLLSDIKAVFENKDIDRISSKILVEELVEIEDHPWGDWRRGKPITQNSLSYLLKPFSISSIKIRFEDKTARGYMLNQFKDAFERYLSHAFTPTPPNQSGTTEQLNQINELQGIQSGTQEKDVPLENPRKPATDGDCSIVPLQKGGTGKDGIERGSKGDQGELFSDEPQGNVDAAFL